MNAAHGSPARRTALLNIVALTEPLLEFAPRLRAFAESRRIAPLTPPLPAVTTTSQSCALTGAPPSVHGIVANGWYDRETTEVRFWQQSNHLVKAPKVWETARERDPSVTCLKMFWWYNMHSSVDWSVTPRPIYCADGRKLPDCTSRPLSLRDELQAKLGTFPLFRFWGPMSDITASRWIAEATRLAFEESDATLTLAYLPHLDYGLQQEGPDGPNVPALVREIDDVAMDLVDFLESRGVEVLVMSEYGIDAVDHAVAPNRALREAGMICVRDELGLEQLVPGDCRALAVCDHQVAHVYVNDERVRNDVRTLLSELPGVDQLLEGPSREAAGLDHPRAGDFILVAERGAWFTYDYWLDDARAPDYARTVDIHRKPGYDPRELFLDASGPAVAWKLLRKKLGFRQLMDVIPLDTSLVRGSHGRVDGEPPILIGPADVVGDAAQMSDVHDVILRGMGL